MLHSKTPEKKYYNFYNSNFLPFCLFIKKELKYETLKNIRQKVCKNILCNIQLIFKDILQEQSLNLNYYQRAQ